MTVLLDCRFGSKAHDYAACADTGGGKITNTLDNVFLQLFVKQPVSIDKLKI